MLDLDDLSDDDELQLLVRLAALRLRLGDRDRESEWSSRLRFGELAWFGFEYFPLVLGDSSLDEDELLPLLLHGPTEQGY